MKRKRNNNQGFTLMEIMCCMIIISIVSSITLPAINNFYSSDRCKSEASILVANIRHAKYKALQENIVNRLIFSDDSQSYKVQTYNDDSASASTIITRDEQDYYDEGWSSIADELEIDINPSIEIDNTELSINDQKTIYFKPDGYLYNNKEELITESKIIFKYGNAAVSIDINGMGVISSEAYSADEDESENEDAGW